MATDGKASKKAVETVIPGSKIWHKNQIALYHDEFPIYQQYADFLRQVLEQVAALYAPDAIIQVRPKSLSSFAEKAIRKALKYDDPVHQVTDLCGGRIITSTLEEVEQISEFIRANFDIDEANSLDVKTRLKVTEFGYLSIHYIVRVRGDCILGMPVPEKIGSRKAEIQVRTFLQHAWAAMSHDRMYKSALRVPEQWVRELAGQAALMENADEAFNRLVKNLEIYKSSYGIFQTKEKLQVEKEILTTILENEPQVSKKSATALKIVRLVKSLGDWSTIIEILEPFAAVHCNERAEILVELGHALCRQNKENPEGADYLRGQSLIAEVAQPDTAATSLGSGNCQDKDPLRSEALLILARSFRDIKGREQYAKELYQQAYQYDPNNPYHLASYLGYNIYLLRDDSFLPLMRHTLLEAIQTCRAHIRAGIELPWAYLTTGRLYLLLGETFNSLAAYAKAIQLCKTENICFPADIFDNELDFLQLINHTQELPKEHQWVRLLLLLGKTVTRVTKEPAPEFTGNVSKGSLRFSETILLVAGGTDASIETSMQFYREILVKALEGYSGTIVSGGTVSGIAGLVGSIAGEFRETNRDGFKLVGYLPQLLPPGISADKRYDATVRTRGEDFSPLEALQSWVDLLAAGISPEKVRFLGINGGDISAFEYRLALAMGAKVGIVESSGRAATELQRDPDWWAAPNLFWLPLDPMTFRAFINPGHSRIKPRQLEELGRLIHRNYQSEIKTSTDDPAAVSWERLSEELKESNRRQAAYAEEIMRSQGFEVRTNHENFVCLEFNDDEAEAMAEMEHGRWVIERLGKGWRYGSKKDTVQKISPYLKPWQEIPEGIKKYDRDAVRNFPKLLKEAGLEIYRA